MRIRLILVCAAVSAVISIAVLWVSALPLGVLGEWTWSRIPYDDFDAINVAPAWMLALLTALAYVGIAWLAVHRLERASRWETAGWMSSLVVGGFAWLWTVQEAPPGAYQLSKAPWVLYYPGASGYFFDARYKIDDTADFLAGYEDKMAEGDVLHVGTHPPGLFLWYRGLLRLCDGAPALQQVLLATQPESVREALDIIDENTRFSPTPLREADRAVLWLAALITQAIAAATVIPLFLLLRRNYSRSTSWLAASFWPFVPAVAVFLPKSDVLFPFIGMLFLYVWLEGRSRQSALWCATAGLLLWLAMLLTLAFLPVALLAALLTVWETEIDTGDARRRDSWRTTVRAVAWGAGGFLAATVVFWLIYDINLPAVWKLNFHNHAGFYAAYPRTYWKWLLVNPVELSLAIGGPLLILAVASYAVIRRAGAGWRDKRLGPHLICPLVWGLLWISGKNMGEAARLWIFLMPWAVWLTAWSIEALTTADGPESSARPPLKGWLIVLLLQVLVAGATVTRVNGFHFADFVGQ